MQTVEDRPRPWSVYDQLAAEYDSVFSSPKDVAEDTIVQELLLESGALNGRVLDIGCGTGLLLDWTQLSTERYIGVDPSEQMLAHAEAKHPRNHFVQVPVEHYLPGVDQFDSIVSLYGSFSYCLAAEAVVPRLQPALRPGGRIFFMLYAPRYAQRASYILRQRDLEVPRRLYTAQQAAHLFRDFDDVKVTGLSRVTDQIERIGERGTLWAARFERFLLGRFFPDQFYFLIVTARRR